MQRIALYSQDTHGLGRMRRNIAIARSLAADEPRALLLISGAGEAAILGLPEGADTLGLPALEDAGHPGSRCLGIGTEALVRLRSQALRSALAAFRPDVLIVDRLPAGVGGELRDSFQTLHRMGTHIVLGLPDVLGDHERVWADWHVSDSIEVVRRNYDRIWVYGDPHVFDPVVDHGLPRDLRRMTRYTGYLDGARADPAATTRSRTIRNEHSLGEGPVHVCLAGGGEDGARLAGAFAETPLPDGSTGVVLTGPFMAPERVAELDAAARRRADLRVLRVLPGADTLIWLADRVIAWAATTRRPRRSPRDSARSSCRRPTAAPTTQLIRARRLENLGAADVLALAQLSPRALSEWIAADARPPAALTSVIDTDGLSRLPELLDELRTPLEVAPRRRVGAWRPARPRVAMAGELAASAAV
jgi:predicted glycosyltransferase